MDLDEIIDHIEWGNLNYKKTNVICSLSSEVPSFKWTGVSTYFGVMAKSRKGKKMTSAVVGEWGTSGEEHCMLQDNSVEKW